MSISTTFQHLNARWKAESPDLFKKTAKTGNSMLAAAALIYGPDVANIPSFHVPHVLTMIAGYLAAGGFSIRVISKLTCQDPTKLDTSNPTDSNAKP